MIAARVTYDPSAARSALDRAHCAAAATRPRDVADLQTIQVRCWYGGAEHVELDHGAAARSVRLANASRWCSDLQSPGDSAAIKAKLTPFLVTIARKWLPRDWLTEVNRAAFLLAMSENKRLKSLSRRFTTAPRRERGCRVVQENVASSLPRMLAPGSTAQGVEGPSVASRGLFSFAQPLVLPAAKINDPIADPPR